MTAPTARHTHPHRLATVVPLASSPGARHRSAAAAAARRDHPSARLAPAVDAVIIPFPIAAAAPGPTP